MKIITLMLTFSLITSCAQMHKSYVALSTGGHDTTKLGLRISGEYDNEFSDTYFGLIHVVFENKSDEWITIKDIEVDFGKDANKHVSFLSPETGKNLLQKYIKSKKKVLLIKAKNRAAWNSALAGVAAGLAAASAASNNSNNKSQARANAVAQGLVTAAIVHEISKPQMIKDPIMKEYPEGHLLRKKFLSFPLVYLKNVGLS